MMTMNFTRRLTNQLSIKGMLPFTSSKVRTASEDTKYKNYLRNLLEFQMITLLTTFVDVGFLNRF
jgi:hypothetical protein